MAVLFVCDHIFFKKNSDLYSHTFSYTFLQRYVNIFSSVTVIARVKEVEDTTALPLASGEGLEFVFLENISTFSSFFGLRQKHEKTMKHIVKEHDAVIVRLPTELGLMAEKIARKNSVKCLVEVVGCAWDIMWHYGGWKSKIYAPILYMRMKSRVKKSLYTSYVTEHFLQERYPSLLKAKTIALSDVVLPNIDENTLIQRIKKIEKLENKIVIGTIASLSVRFKGIDFALKSLSKLAEKEDDFAYHILGEGDSSSYKKVANQLKIGDKVFFDTPLPSGEAVLKWLDNIDIYLQPSFAEGLPRSLIEAMSRGCPCIGSSVGGIPELLDAKLIFKHKEPDGLMKILLRLIRDKTLMYDISKCNFSIAQQYQKSLLDLKREKFWIDFRNA